jgi:hypothetical protein
MIRGSSGGFSIGIWGKGVDSGVAVGYNEDNDTAA